MNPRLSRFVLPGLAALLLFVIATTIGYVTKTDDTTGTALPEAASSAGTRGSVQSLNGNSLTLVTDSGPKQFTLRQDATVEVSKPTSATTIAPGEWLNAGAIANSQTMFSIVGLTLIPPAVLQPR